MLAHSLILLLLFLKLYGITRILLLVHKINLHFCILFSFAVLVISKSFISDVLILVNSVVLRTHLLLSLCRLLLHRKIMLPVVQAAGIASLPFKCVVLFFQKTLCKITF